MPDVTQETSGKLTTIKNRNNNNIDNNTVDLTQGRRSILPKQNTRKGCGDNNIYTLEGD